MSIHDVVHDVYPSFQSDDLQTQRDMIFYYSRLYSKNTPTHEHRYTWIPRAHSSQTQCICNSVFFPLKKKPVVSLPRLCVCGHRGTDAVLSCGHYANEWWRCRDLKAAKLMINPNIYTSAAITLCSCQHTRNNGRSKHTQVSVQMCMCIQMEYTHTEETNLLSNGMLALEQINKKNQ